MIDRWKLRRDKEKALRWKRFLEEEGFADALAQIEQDYIDEWRGALTRRGRERAWHGLKALERLRAKIQAVMTKGQIADHSLNNTKE